MTTGQIQAKLRSDKGIGQKELALHLKVSVGSISNYEHNVHSPDLETICKLADYFNVTTDYLLGRTSYRYDPKHLNRRISRSYTISDVVEIIADCNARSIDRLVDYAKYLRDRQDTNLPKEPAGRKKTEENPPIVR